MVKDLVCNNEVDMSKERFSSWHDGREFWFDTSQCKDLFDADPERYIRAGHAERGPEAASGRKRVREAGERVAAESKSHAKAIFSGRKSDIADTASGLSHALREASRDLRGRSYEDTARFVDKSAEQLESFSARFRDKDADKTLSDAEEYIRERPVFAIGGALAAGFLLARFLKSGAGESAGH